MANPPNIRLRGNRYSMPAGFLLGRAKGGKGPPQLVDMQSLVALAASTVAGGGAGLPGPPGPGGPPGKGSAGMLPLVTGEVPGPIPVADGSGQFIGVGL